MNNIFISLLIVIAFLSGGIATNYQYRNAGKEKILVVQKEDVQLPTVSVSPSQGDALLDEVQKESAIPVLSDKDHIKGNKNAYIALIEYSDFECPFCKRYYPVVKRVLEEYQDQIMVVYRHFPLSIHQNAFKEAEASECAGEIGGDVAFWKFHDFLYERTGSNGLGFALEKLRPLAEEIGLNGEEFQKCLDSGKYTALIKEQIREGQGGGISGTPATVLADLKLNKMRIIPGAVTFETLKNYIDKML